MSLRKWRIIPVTVLASGLIFILGITVSATSGYKEAFLKAYPNASKLADCRLCHTETFGFNAYGKDFKNAGHSFKAIENKDSDGDGASNIEGIRSGTWPGNATSRPAGSALPRPPAGGSRTAGGLFKDIQGHWSEKIIQKMAAQGLVRGYPDGSFRPEAKVTRAEFATLVLRAAGLKKEYPATASFSDVEPWRWYYGPVEALLKAGLITREEGAFRPDLPVRKEEAVRVLVKALGLEEDVSRLSPYEIRNQLSLFVDGDEITSSMTPYVSLAAKKGLIKGAPGKTVQGYPAMRYLGPQKDLKRAEASSLILEFTSLR